MLDAHTNADPVLLGGASDLLALADRDDDEGAVRQDIHQHPQVPLLEHTQSHLPPRKHDGVQREDGQVHGRDATAR